MSLPREALQFALLAFSSLFSVINPISAAPIFVALAPGTVAERRRTALKACLAAAAVLAVFAAAGGAIFAFFQITVPAFQIAGGVLFTMMSLREMDDAGRRVTREDAEKLDPSVVPLGIPVIAGPGAISAMMVLVGQARDGAHRIGLAVALAASIVITLGILFAAPAIVERIGLTGQRVVAKIMGLVTVVIGVQFILNGVTTVLTAIIREARSAP
ncbi:MAG TPA: NAAT family transporter [Thermoanaerobaculia bacterium]